MKMKSVSNSFMIRSILLISAAINLVSVGGKGEGGKYPMVVQSKSASETSL